MNYKTEALVLHTVRYGDSRLIIDMFTREQGRQSYIVSLSKTGRSAIKKQYFQPLTLLIIETDSRPLQQLQRLRSAELLSPWQSLLTEPGKLAIALFVAEFLNYALRGEQKDAQLFDYVKASLEWLDGRSDRYANFHLVFLMRLSRFLGFFPNLSSQESYFDLRTATFCAAPPLHHDYLMPEEAGRIRPLMRMDFATMHLFRLNRTERARMLEIIERYYRLHLPAFPELRSLPVLHELFD
ncbi:MAG: DNA repair protein RecO [Prevotella sp.]|nr:DNA repair protein RecO [Prevotella sp.]